MVLVAALGLFAALVIAAVAPSLAEAGTPAICDDYPDLPICDEGPGGGGGGDDDGGPGGDDGGAGPTAGGDGDGDGSLPFTGYPITDLLLLLALLLVAGLAIRAYLAIRDRGEHGSALP